MKNRTIRNIIVGTFVSVIFMVSTGVTAFALAGRDYIPVTQDYDELEKFDSIISQLKPGQAYALADMCTDYDVLLVSDDGVYDFDGTNAAINATIYGLDEEGNVVELGEANSGHTAYPISVYDGCLLVGNNCGVYMYYVDTNTNDIFTRKTAQVYYEDQVPYYYYSDMETQYEGLVDDDSRLNEMYDLYNEAVVVNFTVVE